MATVMAVMHVMPPAELGKPIDVDEKYDYFVNENARASRFETGSPGLALPYQTIINFLTKHRG